MCLCSAIFESCHCTVIGTLAKSVFLRVREVVEKRIFYGQADRKVGGGAVSPLGPDREQK